MMHDRPKQNEKCVLFIEQVTRLCDLSVDGDSVTSVCWNERVRLNLAI